MNGFIPIFFTSGEYIGPAFQVVSDGVVTGFLDPQGSPLVPSEPNENHVTGDLVEQI